MNTVWLESPKTAQPLADTSTGDADRTLIRTLPPANAQDIAPERNDVEESPIARLILSHGRVPSAVTKGPAPVGPQRPLGFPLTVLTTDATFASQLRAAIGHSHEVNIVETADAAAELAAAGRCSILITDSAMPRSSLDALAGRLRAHDPTTAIVVAGNRDQGGAFIALQSSGIVDGFLLKPVTAAAAELVIEAATRRHRSEVGEASPATSRRPRRRTHTARERSPSNDSHDLDASATIEAKRAPARTDVSIAPIAMPQAATVAPTMRRDGWPVAAIVAVVTIIALGVLGTVLWLTLQRPTGIDANEIATKHLALAERAFAAGRLLDARDGAVHHFQTVLEVDPQNFAAHGGIARVAQELSRQTQTHMAQQRLADAVLSLERLRELQPSYAELPLLDSQLQALQNAVLASHALAAAKPTPPDQPPRSRAQNALRRSPVSASSQPRQVEKAPPQAALPPRVAATNEVATPAPAATKHASESTSVQSTSTLSAVTPATIRSHENNENNFEPSSIAKPNPPPSVGESPPSNQPAATALPATEAAAATASRSSAPVLVKYVPPEYPSAASARRMDGWIVISMEITPGGEVINASIEDGEKRQLFGRAALAAVRQWKYAPDASRAAGARTNVRLEFKLD